MKKVVKEEPTVKNKKTVEQKEDRKEFDLKEVFILWDQVSKGGVKYLSGMTTLPETEEGFKVIAYYNTDKKNPKEPDIRVYSLDNEGKQTDEVAALWEDLSKNDKRYLTGLDNEKRKLIAFYSDLSKHPDAPYIRAYYRNDEE